MRQQILITGATGNIGRAVIKHLAAEAEQWQPIAAVRNPSKAKAQFQQWPALRYSTFDFAEPGTFQPALEQADMLFLLRPPNLADVERYFRPLLETALSLNVSKIIFLSVQGADKSRLIPHHQIEKLIRELGFRYIFIRPGYFMQNLTTALLPEIRSKHRITLPAGRALFNWIDVDNIGEAVARLVPNFARYQGQAIDITGSENLSFYQVATLLSNITGRPIQFRSINPLSFYGKKLSQGSSSGFALVMTMLHFLPRLQQAPPISQHYQLLTGKPTRTLAEFIALHKDQFLSLDQSQ